MRRILGISLALVFAVAPACGGDSGDDGANNGGVNNGNNGPANNGDGNDGAANNGAANNGAANNGPANNGAGNNGPANNGNNGNNGNNNGNNPPPCLRCGAYAAACQSAEGCPDASALCDDAFTLLQAVGACLCGPEACQTDCSQTCTGEGENLETCAACQNNQIDSTCADDFNACTQDL